MQMKNRKDKTTVEVFNREQLMKWMKAALNELMEVYHNVINTCEECMHCVCLCVCIYEQCCALESAWPAGRGSSKVIIVKGIGRRVVRATPLTALGEGNVRWTNPKLLHSTRRRQRTEEQRAGEKRERKQEKERREGIYESQTELLRVGREITTLVQLISVYTKTTGGIKGANFVSLHNFCLWKALYKSQHIPHLLA